MKFNQWTMVLAAAGVVSLGSVVQAEEAQHQVMTALSSTTLSGYVDTSAIWKIDNEKQNYVLPGRSYDGGAKQDGFNLNVVKLSLEKPLDEGNWSAGYKVDLLFGPDANLYNSTSTGLGAAGIGSDFAIKQAYVNMRVPVGNGLDFKMGVFDTCIGYEVFDSASNPNYSRSYGYFIEPLSHTGVLVTYPIVEWFKVSAGIANTYDSVINARATRDSGFAAETEKTYMALIEITAPESLGFLKGATLYAGAVRGLPSTFSVSKNIINYYAGVTVPTPLQGLNVGASYDYRYTELPDGALTDPQYANALALYATYQATEKLKLANRFEYATGSYGTWTGLGTKAPAGWTGDESFLGETFTADYSLWQNVITRAEFRWDHQLHGWNQAPKSFGAGDGLQNACSLALNVIYKF